MSVGKVRVLGALLLVVTMVSAAAVAFVLLSDGSDDAYPVSAADAQRLVSLSVFEGLPPGRSLTCNYQEFDDVGLRWIFECQVTSADERITTLWAVDAATGTIESIGEPVISDPRAGETR